MTDTQDFLDSARHALADLNEQRELITERIDTLERDIAAAVAENSKDVDLFKDRDLLMELTAVSKTDDAAATVIENFARSIGPQMSAIVGDYDVPVLYLSCRQGEDLSGLIPGLERWKDVGWTGMVTDHRVVPISILDADVTEATLIHCDDSWSIIDGYGERMYSGTLPELLDIISSQLFFTEA